jgi:hypothetical protein
LWWTAHFSMPVEAKRRAYWKTPVGGLIGSIRFTPSPRNPSGSRCDKHRPRDSRRL